MASIRERRKADGQTYYAVLHRIDGKQTSDSFLDPARAENFKRLVETYGGESARRIDKADDTTQTLAAYLRTYVRSLTGIEQAARDRYTRFIDRDITGHPIAELPLTAVDDTAVGEWVNTLAATPYRGKLPAAKTIANKHGFLAGATKAAHSRGLIKTDPCAHTRLPQGRRTETVFLTPAEFWAIHAELAARWQPLAVWLVSTGMRFSEATALTVGDVDQRTNTVRISKAWKYATSTKAQQLGTTKTRKGVRTISVPPDALAALDLQRPADALLFVNANSERIKQKMFYEPWAAARTAAFDTVRKKPRIHDLRHTCASWMIQAGTPLPVVQDHLGHESIQTTIGVYGHLDRSAMNAAAEAIAAALKPPKD